MAFSVNTVKNVTLTNGEELKLPRMTLGKILAVTNAISTLVKAVKKEYPELFKGNETDIAALGMHVLNFLPEMLPAIGNEIIGVIATYLGKPPDWVADTMDAEDLVNVATPFLQTIMSQGNHLLGAINKGLPEEKVSPSPSTKVEEKPSEVLPT